MSCTKVGDFCKLPQEITLLRIPIRGGAFIKFFEANEILAAGDVRRPKKENGFEYEVTVGGQCARSEPEWPEIFDETITSGSVTFECRAISNGSLARVAASCVWSGGTLTISGEGLINTNGEQEVFAKAAGGTQNDVGEVSADIIFDDGTKETAILSYHVD